MIVILAKNKLKQGTRDEFLKLAKEMETESRKETGCISYHLYEDLQDPQSFCFIEEYKDQNAVDIHNQSSYFKTLVPQINELKEDSDIARYKLASN